MRPRRASSPAHRDRNRFGSDSGYSLMEALVAIVLIGLVMAAASAFFIGGVRNTDRQRLRQTAIVLGEAAMEKARSLDAGLILTGRDKTSSDTQWAAPVSGVNLTAMNEAWDTTAATGSGSTANLPTTAQTQVVKSLTYSTNYYVGTCYQPVGGGTCDSAATSGYVKYYRIIVAVTWTPPGGCTGICSYVSTTLVSSTTDPIFNLNATASPSATATTSPTATATPSPTPSPTRSPTPSPTPVGCGNNCQN